MGSAASALIGRSKQKLDSIIELCPNDCVDRNVSEICCMTWKKVILGNHMLVNYEFVSGLAAFKTSFIKNLATHDPTGAFLSQLRLCSGGKYSQTQSDQAVISMMRMVVSIDSESRLVSYCNQWNNAYLIICANMTSDFAKF